MKETSNSYLNVEQGFIDVCFEMIVFVGNVSFVLTMMDY
jgi:hypothetical protein